MMSLHFMTYVKPQTGGGFCVLLLLERPGRSKRVGGSGIQRGSSSTVEKSNWRKNRGYCIFKCKIMAIYITNGKIRDIVKLSKKPSWHKTCSRHLGIVLELSCLDKTFSRYLNFILESSYLVDLFIYTYTHTNTRTHTDIHIYIYIYIYMQS